MWKRGLGMLLMASACSVVACASDDSPSSESAPPVSVPDDRSVDVSYSGDMIELSFARLGNSFREMHARVLKLSDGDWVYFGILRTANANTVGFLTPAAEGAEGTVEVLDGVNTATAPDQYLAPGLTAGQYLVCAIANLDADQREVCGELSVS